MIELVTDENTVEIDSIAQKYSPGVDLEKFMHD